MITVSIDGLEKSLDEATHEGWIAEQFARRGREARIPCVRVNISDPSVHLVLATPNCGSFGGGGRRLTAKEREVLELWEKQHLSGANFTPGDVQAFLRRLSQLL